MLKWVLRISAVVVIFSALGAYLFVRYLGTSGSGAVEQWIASELQKTANAYLNPRLSFADLDYEYPGTVHLKELTLIADNPAKLGEKVTIIAAETATVVLSEIPSIGKPFVIERISFNKPIVQLIAREEGSSDFVGLTDMVKTTDASTQPTAEGPGPKLSEVFQMRLVELKGAKVIYDARIPNTQPMVLDDISTRLDVQPTLDGWYKLATKLVRDRLLDLKVEGELSLDTFDVRGLQLALKLQVDREHDKFLPPQLQQVLIEHEARGALELKLAGDVKSEQPMQSKLNVDVRLTDANLSINEYQIPIDDLMLTLHVADGRFDISELVLKALHGETRITADLPLKGEPILNATLVVRDVVLQDTLRKGNDATAAQYRGRLNADITLKDAPIMAILHRATPPEAPANDPRANPDQWVTVNNESPARGETAEQVEEKLNVELTKYALVEMPDYWGGGQIVVDDAKLVAIPVMRELSKLVSKLKGAKKEPSERVELIFDFRGDHIDLSKFDYRGDAPSHGRGTISLDQKLDLTIDAGGVLGSFGDALLAYRVVGPADSPDFKIRAGSEELTQGTRKVGGAIGTGAKKTGAGIGWIGRKLGNIGKKDE